MKLIFMYNLDKEWYYHLCGTSLLELRISLSVVFLLLHVFSLPTTQGLPDFTSGQPPPMVKLVGVSFRKNNIFGLMISYPLMA